MPTDPHTILDAFRLHQQRRHLADDTIDNDATLLRSWVRHLEGDLWSATKHDVWAFLNPDHTAGTNAWKLSRIGCFYKWAILEELCDTDPTMKIQRPKVPEGLPRPAATGDILAELERADARTRAMLGLGAFCGLRVVEVWRTRGEDLDAEGWLRVHGKGGKERDVFVVPTARQLVDEYGWPASGPVFWTLDRTRPLARRSMRVMINRWLQHFTFHQLRHAFLDLFHEKSGNDLLLTSEYAGHSSTDTTKIYTKLRNERAARVAEAVARHYQTGRPEAA